LPVHASQHCCLISCRAKLQASALPVRDCSAHSCLIAAGLWLFSRKPEDPGAVKVMRAKAAALGFDLSVLKPVTQKGCTYPST
jgi:hypothetical protein